MFLFAFLFSSSCFLLIGVTNGMTTTSFDNRPTLSRAEAKQVYNDFASKNHKQGGKDASSGYGGPAVSALLKMADFESAKSVMDFGCGQGKLAELVLSQHGGNLHYWGIDQSPNMVKRFQDRCIDRFGSDKCRVDLIEHGDPSRVLVPESVPTVDRFVSTYCLDLLSEDDMYRVLDLAESVLDPNGLLLLSGITWGYRDSVLTCVMTFVWEILYRVYRKKVGGCRPQHLRPYLEARGWIIVDQARTLPDGYPWMVSEVVSARPPINKKKIS